MLNMEETHPGDNGYNDLLHTVFFFFNHFNSNSKVFIIVELLKSFAVS